MGPDASTWRGRLDRQILSLTSIGTEPKPTASYRRSIKRAAYTSYAWAGLASIVGVIRQSETQQKYCKYPRKGTANPLKRYRKSLAKVLDGTSLQGVPHFSRTFTGPPAKVLELAVFDDVSRPRPHAPPLLVNDPQ